MYSIYTSNDLLLRFSQIPLLRRCRLTSGMKIARGFADIGFEEFCLLPGNKILSLFTGACTVYQEEDRQHFFFVPPADAMIDILEQEGIEIYELSSADRRTWSVKGRFESGEQKVFQGATLLEGLLPFLELLLEDSNV